MSLWAVEPDGRHIEKQWSVGAARPFPNIIQETGTIINRYDLLEGNCKNGAKKKGPQTPVRLFWKHKILWNVSALHRPFLAIVVMEWSNLGNWGKTYRIYQLLSANFCTLKSPFSRLQLKLVSLTCVPLFGFKLKWTRDAFCLGKSVKFASFLRDSVHNNILEIAPWTVKVWNNISDEGIINNGGS